MGAAKAFASAAARSERSRFIRSFGIWSLFGLCLFTPAATAEPASDRPLVASL